MADLLRGLVILLGAAILVAKAPKYLKHVHLLTLIIVTVESGAFLGVGIFGERWVVQRDNQRSESYYPTHGTTMLSGYMVTEKGDFDRHSELIRERLLAAYICGCVILATLTLSVSEYFIRDWQGRRKLLFVICVCVIIYIMIVAVIGYLAEMDRQAVPIRATTNFSASLTLANPEQHRGLESLAWECNLTCPSRSQTLLLKVCSER